ncbi:MAG: hypothetical protein IAF94_08635 [Pirellulaceae bacterium]|nr:hypothetical protein [Pirellulaceae bacterium]
MTSTISARHHYNLYLTNTKDNSHEAGPYALLMPNAPSFRGTPAQIRVEVQNFRRISGGCDIAYRVTDDQGQTVDLTGLWLEQDMV